MLPQGKKKQIAHFDQDNHKVVVLRDKKVKP